MFQANSNERRTMILEMLSIKRKTTAKTLAQKYNVSSDTIYRDIYILSEMYPIYTVKGIGGGIFVDSDWKYTKRRLNFEQVEFLNKVINSSKSSIKDIEIAKSIIKDFSPP